MTQHVQAHQRYRPDRQGSSRPATHSPDSNAPAGGRGHGHYDVIVIGGGQAGLSVGYHLTAARPRFVILDASARIGDAWRKRWDSLRLFTPARFDGLDGMPFPGPAVRIPDQGRDGGLPRGVRGALQLPVRSGVRVERLCTRGRPLSRRRGRRSSFEADHVVVAMASYQGRKRARRSPASCRPTSSSCTRSSTANPAQLRPGGVLVVGAGNSGAEIAVELCARTPTWLSGRDDRRTCRSASSGFGRGCILMRCSFRVRVSPRPHGQHADGPQGAAEDARAGRAADPGQSRNELAAGRRGARRASRRRAGRLPLLEDGRTLDVRNVIWCTGFDGGLVVDRSADLRATTASRARRAASSTSEPGLYFVGQHFLHSLSSTMIHGVGRDAQRMVRAIEKRRAQRNVARARALLDDLALRREPRRQAALPRLG